MIPLLAALLLAIGTLAPADARNSAGIELARARAILGTAIETRPNDPRTWLRRAEFLVATGDFWAAIDDATQAIDIDPTRIAGFALRASLWRRINVPDMAIADLERALEIEPDSLGLRAQLARLRAAAAPTPTALSAAALDLQAVMPGAGAARSQLVAFDIVTTQAAQSRRPRSLLPDLPAEPMTARSSRPDSDASALDALTLAAAQPTRPRRLFPEAQAPTPAAALDNGTAAAGRPSAPMPPRPLVPQQIVALPAAPRHIAPSEMARLAAIAPSAAPAVPPVMPEPATPLRISNAPPPRIFRGSQIPTELEMRAGLPRETPARSGIGGPFTPLRDAAPPAKAGTARATFQRPPARRRLARVASFDATPVDAMREQLVPAPTLAVTRETLP